MTEVVVRNGDFERALRRFRTVCLPVMKELKDRSYYETRTERKKRKVREAVSRLKRKGLLRRAEPSRQR